MKPLNEQQKKKIAKLLVFEKDKDEAYITSLIEINEKLDKLEQDILSTRQNLSDTISNIEIPEPIDESERLNKILNKLDEEDELEVILNVI